MLRAVLKDAAAIVGIAETEFAKQLGPSEKDPETNDVLLVATRTENVEQRQAAVNAAGLTAKIVDVEAFALENACRLMTHQMPDGGIDRTIAVVDFGASSTTFSVLRNLKVIYTRDFAFGGQQLTEEIMRTYGLSMEEALEVSDHLPIWATFNATENAQSGVLATRPTNRQ